MDIPINKVVKVSEHNGSLRMSIPNMVHTITEIKDGDAIIYHSMKYDKETKIITVTLKIVEAEKDDEKSNIHDKI